MTERLYYTDAYQRQFDARVMRRTEGARRLYLDRTAFYPTSGGQPHDSGTIDGVSVIDVVDEGTTIAHVTAAPVIADRVSACVDWPRRHDLMQQHTGQHLISAVFADSFGYQTISVHFGDKMSSLDLDTNTIDLHEIREAEARANALIAENRQVVVSFEHATDATGLRKPSDRDGILRIVSIDGVDRSACGGTHVRSTAEIGVLLLRRQEKIRKNTRIEFVCGQRAARRARADYEAIAGIAHALSASVDEVPGLVNSQLQQLKEAETAGRRLATEIADLRAREHYAATEPDANGMRRFAARLDTGSLDEWRSFAIAMSTLPRAVCVIGIGVARSVVVSASEDSDVDAGAIMKRVTAAEGGRGGGSARLAQGVFPDDESFARALPLLGG
ncbi:MAG: Alanine--tRNA ligase [Gemmatimonadaceae bacterium]|nr:Alanine--tRNA ligase [Gemmatimonadaceae bacterium]